METESKASQAITEKMEQIEPGTPRYNVLDTARRFKTTWVDLGRTLWEVRQKKLFLQWGYEKFDDYCQGEIRIKPRTASKLTASYSFLKTEEPSVLRRDGVEKPVPDVQVIDMLRRIHDDDDFPRKEFERIKEIAFDDASLAKVRQEVREHRPEPAPPPRAQLIKRLLTQANRLAEAIASADGLPPAITERAVALADDLRTLGDE